MHSDLFYKLQHKLLCLQMNVLKAEIVGSAFENKAMNLQREKKRETETWSLWLINCSAHGHAEPRMRFRLNCSLVEISSHNHGHRAKPLGHIHICPERQFSTPLPLGCIKQQVNIPNYLGNGPFANGACGQLVFCWGSVPTSGRGFICCWASLLALLLL